jgi:hypothetical protein
MTSYIHEDGTDRFLPEDSDAERAAIRARDALVVANRSTGRIDLPLGAFQRSSGAAVGVFLDNTTDGFYLSDSEAFGIRWNNDTAPRATLAASVHIPEDADDAVAMTLYCRGLRVGAADAAMVLTVAIYNHENAEAHTAGTNVGGSTTAFNGATTIITTESLAVAAGALPAGSNASITIVPDAALDGDDFILLDAWLDYSIAV